MITHAICDLRTAHWDRRSSQHLKARVEEARANGLTVTVTPWQREYLAAPMRSYLVSISDGRVFAVFFNKE